MNDQDTFRKLHDDTAPPLTADNLAKAVEPFGVSPELAEVYHGAAIMALSRSNSVDEMKVSVQSSRPDGHIVLVATGKDVDGDIYEWAEILPDKNAGANPQWIFHRKNHG